MKEGASRSLAGLVIALALWGAFATAASAQDYEQTVIVALDQDYAPHEYVEDGTITGFNTDIMRALAAEGGFEIEWKPLVWKDAYQALQLGEADILCMSAKDEREPFFEFTDPILEPSLAIFVHESTTGLATLTELAGLTVAVQNEDISHLVLREKSPEALIVPVDSQEDALQLLADGQVTAFLGNRHTGLNVIARRRYEGLKIIGEPIPIAPRVMAVAKGNTQLQEKLNEAIATIKASGEYDRILNRWYGQEIVSQLPWRQAGLIAGGVFIVAALVIAGILLWNRTLQRQVAKQTQELALLDRVFTAAGTALEPETILALTCRELALAFDVPQVAAALLNESRTEATVVAEHLEEGRPSAMGMIIPVENNPATQYVLEHKAPLAITDAQTDARMAAVHDLQQQRGTASLLILPLIVRDEVVGTIGLDSVERREFDEEEIGLGANAAAAAAQVLGNAQLLAAERAAREQSDTLREIAHELNAAPSLEAALDLVLSRMEQVIALDSGAIMLLEGEEMRVVALRGFEEPERVLNTKLDLDVALLNREVLETRRPLIVGSVSSDSRWLKSVEASGLTPDLERIRSWMGVPLLIQDRVIGMLTADRAKQDFYRDKDAELALAFASHAAVAIENARLLESERAQLKLAQTLQRVGALLTTRMSLDEVFEQVYDLLAQVVAYDSVSVQLLDQDGNLELRSGRGFADLNAARQTISSIASRPLEERWGDNRVMVIPDTQANARWVAGPGVDHIRSWIGAALVVKELQVGLLNVDSATANAYDEATGETIAAFANQAAVAIENARLYDQAQQEIIAREEAEKALHMRTRELGLLYEAARQLGRTLDMEAVYDTLHRQISKFMDCDSLRVSSSDSSSNRIECLCAWRQGERIDIDVRGLAPVPFESKEGTAQDTVVQRGEPLLVKVYEDGIGSDHRDAQTAEQAHDAEPIRSAVLAPMKLEGQVVGVIEVQSKKAGAYTEDDLRILEAMALQVAVARANASLYQQAQHEIAERVRTEREIAKRQMYLEGVLAAVPDAIVTLDAQHRIMEWNKGAEKLFGYTLEEVVGRDLDRLITNPDTWEEAVGLTQTVTHHKQMVPLQQTIRYRKDGTPVHVVLAGAPIVVGDELIGVVASYTDMTDQVRAEEALRQRAAQQEALNAIIAAAGAAADLPELLDTALDHTLHALGLEMGGTWVSGHTAVRGVAPDTTEVGNQMEPAPATSSGHAPATDPGHAPATSSGQEAALRHESASEPLPTAKGFMARPDISAALAAPIEAEGRHIGEIGVADKEPREWTAEEVALLEAVGQQLGTAVERLRLLERIREQAYKVHQIVDTVPEGMILLGENGHVILANPVAREYLAVLAEAEVGDALAHLGGRPLGELLAPVEPGGRWHEISVTGPPAHTFEVIARALETGSDGESTESEGWVMVMRDVTHEREFQERIQHQQRLAAVGQLAAGIAHDFNNIMAVVVLYSQMALRFPGVPPEVAERLHTILGQAKRATDLIQQILDFGRRAVLKRSPLDVEPLLKEQVKLLERTLPENIRVEMAVGPGEHTVNADVTRIQQMIMNLVLNSRDAMPEGGELDIALDRLLIKTGEPLPSQEMEPGEWIRIMVTDNGTGIPQDVLPRVFEPFFTTKAPLGTGLGLSQVYGIVAQHGGHVTVESEVGEGTTFALFLPALPGIQHDTTAQATPIIHEGRGETILIVEDDPTTRAALVDGVEGLNYQVLEAGDGREALDICRAHEGRISLVLSDLIMPEMGGMALLEGLQQQYPEIKMVMLSGHPLDEIKGANHEGIAEWLQKPIDLDELAEALRRAL